MKQYSKKELDKIYKDVAPYIIKTPLITNEYLNELLGFEVVFKCENLQRIGAFKARGAFRALLSLSTDQLKKGVATHSSGNHAQALALAAKERGAKATIIMPENSPKIKIKGVKELGADIIFCPPTFEDREKTLQNFVEKSGAEFVPPFDDQSVIEGQSTCAYEILNEIPDTQIIFAPVGGGGLISGTCIAANAFDPEIEVYGAEPQNMDEAYQSLKQGILLKNSPGKTTIADGLRTNLGQLPFEYMQYYLKEIIPVPEENIMPAMKILWERLKIIIEPSCAVPFAAILKHKERFKGKKVAVILTGGNVDLETVRF